MRQRQQATTVLLNPKPIAAWRPGTLARHGNPAIADLVAALGSGNCPATPFLAL
jgi:hypothetical protein